MRVPINVLIGNNTELFVMIFIPDGFCTLFNRTNEPILFTHSLKALQTMTTNTSPEARCSNVFVSINLFFSLLTVFLFCISVDVGKCFFFHSLTLLKG